MSDNSVIEVNDDDNKIEIEDDKIDVDKIDFDKIDVDKNDDKNDADQIEDDKIDVDKIFTFDDEPHNSNSITMAEISPKEKCLIIYSEEKRSIVCWNVKDIDKVQLKFHQTVEINENNEDNEDKKYKIESLCVSDDKKLAYIHQDRCYVIDMNNKDKKIALDLNKNKNYIKHCYCTFNLDGELILYSLVGSYFGEHKIIWIYSTQTKNNKWECKRFYRIPEDYELISISKYDKVYLFSNDYIYEWNINTERGVKIFGNNNNNKDKNKFETKNIGIFSNEKLIFLKINDKIIVYSIELGIPIASLDINDDIQLYNFMNHTGLFLLPSLFYYIPDKEIKYCWNNKYKSRFNQISFDEPTDKPTDESTDDQTKLMFGILRERVWKSKFDEKMSKMNFSSENSDELNKENDKIVERDEYLNVHSFNLYMGTVSKLFQEAINDRKSIELTGNLITWNIHVYEDKIKLVVFKKIKKINTEWEAISMKTEYHPYDSCKLITGSLFNNNDIVILTTFGILIYTFSENNKSIFLNYFYFMKFDMKILQHYKRMFSKSTLPLPNYDSYRLGGWVSDVINNKSSLLKYGVELLKFAIKEHKLELIDDIYKKCMTYFKEDLMNNKSFLSIITSAMPLLDEYYPEYILKCSSETNMIIDSFFYSIKHQNKNLHLYSFLQTPQIANLSQSLLWTKFCYKISCTIDRYRGSSLLIFIWLIISVIQALIILLALPLCLATFYILSKYNFINNIYNEVFSLIYFNVEHKIFKIFKKYITTTPMITFMIPYINFVNYSRDYNWFVELIKPQPSPFTETINRNIYKTWNGEALINFKWNAYGKYYYAMIWILFIALLGCFTTAATIPQKYINEEVRQQLFIASIILGFIHLIFEIRQFFYNIAKWFYNFWNIFGKYKCLI
ncbi:hypothetical protein RhiirA4_545380 [Rhizophagus irregularis]|uniref:Ion transport domain-containing protein n=1 Tax=Rhizophagus irregularis TaxID=588596 RepID=A0A2I1GSK4_9GLOM|nr:hypothetical protein RhiirA4_545380 [Rhizophagus irregularis]